MALNIVLYFAVFAAGLIVLTNVAERVGTRLAQLSSQSKRRRDQR